MADHAAERVVLSPADQEMKLAVRSLVDAFGGCDAVGAHFGRDYRRISELCNPALSQWMRLPWISELERMTVGLPGHPHVTRLLARRAGFVLVKRTDGQEDGAGVMAGLAAVQAELGDVARVVIDAAKDGELDRAERKAALDQLAEVEARAASLRVLLEGGARA